MFRDFQKWFFQMRARRAIAACGPGLLSLSYGSPFDREFYRAKAAIRRALPGCMIEIADGVVSAVKPTGSGELSCKVSL
jgi:hypothetical protein